MSVRDKIAKILCSLRRCIRWQSSVEMTEIAFYFSTGRLGRDQIRYLSREGTELSQCSYARIWSNRIPNCRYPGPLNHLNHLDYLDYPPGEIQTT